MQKVRSVWFNDRLTPDEISQMKHILATHGAADVQSQHRREKHSLERADVKLWVYRRCKASRHRHSGESIQALVTSSVCVAAVVQLLGVCGGVVGVAALTAT